MTTAQHTPGPWTMTEDSGDCALSLSYQIGIDAPIRESEGFDTYLATVVHGDPDELMANARLIASAPDLLAALAECITETPGAACYNTGKKTRRLEAINEIVRAAIARATGAE